MLSSFALTALIADGSINTSPIDSRGLPIIATIDAVDYAKDAHVEVHKQIVAYEANKTFQATVERFSWSVERTQWADTCWVSFQGFPTSVFSSRGSLALTKDAEWKKTRSLPWCISFDDIEAENYPFSCDKALGGNVSFAFSEMSRAICNIDSAVPNSDARTLTSTWLARNHDGEFSVRLRDPLDQRQTGTPIGLLRVDFSLAGQKDRSYSVFARNIRVDDAVELGSTPNLDVSIDQFSDGPYVNADLKKLIDRRGPTTPATADASNRLWTHRFDDTPEIDAAASKLERIAKTIGTEIAPFFKDGTRVNPKALAELPSAVDEFRELCLAQHVEAGTLPDDPAIVWEQVGGRLPLKTQTLICDVLPWYIYRCDLSTPEAVRDGLAGLAAIAKLGETASPYGVLEMPELPAGLLRFRHFLWKSHWKRPFRQDEFDEVAEVAATGKASKPVAVDCLMHAGYPNAVSASQVDGWITANILKANPVRRAISLPVLTRTSDSRTLLAELATGTRPSLDVPAAVAGESRDLLTEFVAATIELERFDVMDSREIDTLSDALSKQ